MPDPIEQKKEQGTPALAWAAAVLLCLWTVGAMASYRTQTWTEARNSGALCALGVILLVAGRGPAGWGSRASVRLALLGLFAAGVIALNPAFEYMPNTFLSSTVDAGSKLGSYLPFIVCLLIWLLFLFHPTAEGQVDALPLTVAERLEVFLSSASARRNLFLLILIAVPVTFGLSGFALSRALLPTLTLAALILASGPMLQLARTRLGALAILLAPTIAAAFAAVMGMGAYQAMTSVAEECENAAQSRNGEAMRAAYDKVANESNRLRAFGPRIEVDSSIARYYEREGNPGAAAVHWAQVANFLKINPEDYAPWQRDQCAQGESRAVWRRFVYEGFAAIDSPGLAPGIQQLGKTATDLRGKLLAALFAWNRNDPEQPRRELLMEVQRVSPGEPTSYGLLTRLGEKLPPPKDGVFWLPPELLIGRKGSPHSADGLIEEIGEVGTMVYLEPGRWELTLQAAGTPLHEQWPVVRIELGGQVLGPTQVNRAEVHGVPFSFDVTRRDLFTLRVIFQNFQEDLEEGRIARRGLKIAGMRFSHAKE